jgi:hypothetical protein
MVLTRDICRAITKYRMELHDVRFKPEKARRATEKMKNREAIVGTYIRKWPPRTARPAQPHEGTPEQTSSAIQMRPGARTPLRQMRSQGPRVVTPAQHEAHALALDGMQRQYHIPRVYTVGALCRTVYQGTGRGSATAGGQLQVRRMFGDQQPLNKDRHLCTGGGGARGRAAAR